MKGVLDRFEADKAVILPEDIQEEIVVNKGELPAKSDVNTWFEIETKDGVHQLSIDADKTEREAEKSAELMDRLRAKSRGSKFKKK